MTDIKIFISVLPHPTDRSGDLFTLDPSWDTLDVASCDDDEIISCVYANVNPDAINADQIMVEGVMWTKVEPLQDEVTDESFSAEFSSPDGSTAVFTVRVSLTHSLITRDLMLCINIYL